MIVLILLSDQMMKLGGSSFNNMTSQWGDEDIEGGGGAPNIFGRPKGGL